MPEFNWHFAFNILCLGLCLGMAVTAQDRGRDQIPDKCKWNLADLYS